MGSVYHQEQQRLQDNGPKVRLMKFDSSEARWEEVCLVKVQIMLEHLKEKNGNQTSFYTSICKSYVYWTMHHCDS